MIRKAVLWTRPRRPGPARHRCRLRPGALAGACLALALIASPLPAQTNDFEQANKLYELGRYAEAAAAYERLATNHPGSVAAHFNRGNAWYKAGQVGRALAAWWQAARIDPRDPDVRFNLQFVRKEVAGDDAPAPPLWQQVAAGLTPAAWQLLASAAFWLFFLVLALRELRPAWRRALRLPAVVAGGLFILSTAGALAARALERRLSAVVIVPQGIVRYGPVEESQVHYQLRDGSEVIVLDRQPGTPGQPAWLQVQDASRRTGWIKDDQVLLLQ
ncbi:MAG TPA: tetratricopeptide repeat protein [Methylomirabilota bacterium]|nr:tetratricopeptide repeat protein [Methylomirabilota bacterium]